MLDSRAPFSAILPATLALLVVWDAVSPSSSAASRSAPRAADPSPAARASSHADAPKSSSSASVSTALASITIPKSPGCMRGAAYPDCRWRIPSPADAGFAYTIWRNTSEEHLWGRPALVRLLLEVAHRYANMHPGEAVAVGDLDAPGPRHETHDRGVDADLYLPGMMAAENEGPGRYPSNYDGHSPLTQRMLRSRVEDLARLLAELTSGRLRIYYNDEPVARRVAAWFRARAYRSPFGRVMQGHNTLHRFHFHVTIPDDLEI